MCEKSKARNAGQKFVLLFCSFFLNSFSSFGVSATCRARKEQPPHFVWMSDKSDNQSRYAGSPSCSCCSSCLISLSPLSSHAKCALSSCSLPCCFLNCCSHWFLFLSRSFLSSCASLSFLFLSCSFLCSSASFSFLSLSFLFVSL